jgi:hypothetical protein
MSAFLPAASAGTPEPRVLAVEVEGLTRTRRETVLHLARVREGDPWREGLDAEARQLLLNAGLFYDVEVGALPAEGGVRLRIVLREKWTLVPVPLVVARDGETTWGVTLLEANLLGSGIRLITTLSVTEGRPGGTLILINPHAGSGRLQHFAALTRSDLRGGLWEDDDETGSLRRLRTGVTAALGYRLLARTSLSAGVRVMDFSFTDPQGAAVLPPDASERALALMFRHEGADQDEERRLGLSAEARFERGLSLLGDDLGRTAVSGTLRHSLPLAGRTTLTLTGHALWTDSPDHDPGSRPLASFLRGFPADRFRPDRLLGGTVELEVPVARFRTATLSLVPFADGAVLRDGSHRFRVSDARADTGLSLAVYLRRIALPVLQFHLAYGFPGGGIPARLLPGSGFLTSAA